MRQELLNLSKLVEFESTAGHSDEIEKTFAYVDEQLQAIFPFVKKEYVKEYEKDGKKESVLSVVWSTQDTLSPDIILNAHLDVVPGSAEMFEMKKKDGKLTGRGTMDMKFAVASFISAVAEIDEQIGLENVSLSIMLTSDEERGGFHGVNHLVNDIGYRAKLVIIPDGGYDWHIVSEAKGASWIKLTTKGESAHASRPWEGKSAIDSMVEILYWFRSQYKNPAAEAFVTTTNLGAITGGTTPNQVANEATATIDVRYTAELTAADIISQLQKQFPELDIKTLVDKPYFNVDPQNELIQKWARLVRQHKSHVPTDEKTFVQENGSADHHYFSTHGIPVLMMAPAGGLIHTENEWLDEADFILFSKLLGEYLVSVFSENLK